MSSRKHKWLAAILIAALAITATTGAVYAYLSATTDLVENSFTPVSDPDITIVETFATTPDSINLIKENVCVDVGESGYAVYVRVAIVVTWKNADKEVYGQIPVAGTDYTIKLNVGDDAPWFYNSKDGFYYLESMVYSGKTEELIRSCYQTAAAPETGYTLHVEIIAQTIQAKGSTDRLDENGNPIPAVTDAWGVTVGADDKLTP